MIESWDELIEKLGNRSGMWVGRPKYSLVCSFIAGFAEARGDGVIGGFQSWLSSQPQHRAISNFAWWTLILHEAFPDRDQPPLVDTSEVDPEWPRSPNRPVGEDDLSYPDDDAVAIAHLFTRLREYIDQRP